MTTLTEKEVALAQYFHRNGCWRTPHEARFEEGSDAYKKGYEVRFVANDEAESQVLLDLLQATGFKSGKPYRKHRSQTIIPVYGREAAEQFDLLLHRVAKK